MEIKEIVYDVEGKEVSLRVGELTEAGEVTSIKAWENNNVTVIANGKLWMTIPAHKVCRWLFIYEIMKMSFFPYSCECCKSEEECPVNSIPLELHSEFEAMLIYSYNNGGIHSNRAIYADHYDPQFHRKILKTSEHFIVVERVE